MGWIDLIRMGLAGGLLAYAVVKIVLRRPYYLERIRPRFWLPIVKGMNLWEWVRLLLVSSSFAIIIWFATGWTAQAIATKWELYSEEEYIFTRLGEISMPSLFLTVNLLPIFEEWVFRCIILEEVARRARSRWFGVLASALIFAAFHLSNPGTYPAFTIPLIFAGVLLGICYLVGGLAGAICCHCFYNSLVALSWIW